MERDRDCLATLAWNRPGWRLVPADVRNLRSSDLLEAAGLARGEAALVAGGPPCQPFSSMGKGLGATDPRNGDLCLEFVRLVRESRPRAFIMENVPGLLHRKHRPFFERLLGEFEAEGYSVAYHVLNAADYGAPQLRKRLFVLGARSGAKPPAFPLPTHFESEAAWRTTQDSVGGALAYRPWATAGEVLAQADAIPKSRSDYVLAAVSPFQRARMQALRPGEDLRALPIEMRPERWRKANYNGPKVFGRMRPDRPCFTIRTEAYRPEQGIYIHPSEDRGLSSHELAALQSFPPDWVFRSAKGEQIALASAGRQIGNAVPPLLARAVGLALKASLNEPLRESGGR